MSTRTLHTINKTSAHLQLNAELATALSSDDAILLIEDGVYQMMDLHVAPEGHWSRKCGTIYALKDDVCARGIEPSQSETVTLASYADYVALCAAYDKVINWY